MKVNDIKIEDLENIFEFYNQYCGGKDIIKANLKLEQVLIDIKNKGITSKDGYRLGSNWSDNSKLRFYVRNNEVIPIFNLNMQESDMFYDEAQEFSKEINTKLFDYVNNL